MRRLMRAATSNADLLEDVTRYRTGVPVHLLK
jgi:hypothetical protein